MERNNSGAIFKNRHKTADKQPDYKGDAVIDGVKKQIAVWTKQDKNGNDYFSLRFEDPREAGNSAESKTTDATANNTANSLYEEPNKWNSDGLPF